MNKLNEKREYLYLQLDKNDKSKILKASQELDKEILLYFKKTGYNKK